MTALAYPSPSNAERKPPRAAGFSHRFRQQVIDDVLRAAARFNSRPRRGPVVRPKRVVTAGDAIRERIAVNAAKRLATAKAMKAEAGVKDHHFTGEGDGGIAWTDRARILAPVGENRLQLATLAHECGHIFLHSIGTPGNGLPTHVKEMEAEAYAHEAFRAHGIRMPKSVTQWGREYVGRWVLEDHAAGIAVDLRAVDYALGTLSPYDLLRIVPATWTHVDPGVARPTWWMRLQQRVARRRANRIDPIVPLWLDFAWRCACFGCLGVPALVLYFGFLRERMLADGSTAACAAIVFLAAVAGAEAVARLERWLK